MYNRLMSLASAGVLLLVAHTSAFAAQGSGCLPTTGVVSGLTMTQKINDAIAAITSAFSGASAPSTDCSAAPVKGQTWLDTSVTPNVERRYDGNSWVAVGAIDATNHLWAPPVGGGMAAITASTTTDICAAPAAVQSITGTTTITSFGTACVVGARKTLIFNSATPLTYNASTMILPGQRNYTTQAGDMADAIYLGSGNWRVKDISRIDGTAVVNPSVPLGTVLMGDYGTIPGKTVVGQGQALSRASYPDYFSAVTEVQAGTLTAGNNTITSLASTWGYGPGMPVEGIGVQPGTTIVSTTSTTIVMSATATANGSQSIRVFKTGYGTGGDSTTVGVKDCLGRTLAGHDPTGVLPGGAPVNKKLGVASVTLPQSSLPNVAPTFIGNLISGLRGSLGFDPLAQAGILSNGTGGGPGQNGQSGGAGTNAVFIDAFTPSGTITSINGGVAQTSISLISPTVTAECVVAVLP